MSQDPRLVLVVFGIDSFMREVFYRAREELEILYEVGGRSHTSFVTTRRDEVPLIVEREKSYRGRHRRRKRISRP